MTTPTSAVRWATAAAAGDPVALARQEIAGLSAPLRAGYAATCNTCGRVGREGVEVSTQYHWLGGVGHVLRTYCRDVPSCFARRERKEAMSVRW